MSASSSEAKNHVGINTKYLYIEEQFNTKQNVVFVTDQLEFLYIEEQFNTKQNLVFVTDQLEFLYIEEQFNTKQNVVFSPINWNFSI